MFHERDVWQGRNTTFVHSRGAVAKGVLIHSLLHKGGQVISLCCLLWSRHKRRHNYLKMVGSLFLAIVVKFWPNGYNMC